MSVAELAAGAGFPYPEDVILTFVGGSQLHGAKLDGTDDTDYYGVFIEPPEKALGIDRYEHFVYTTGSERGRNTKDDLDVVFYTLRKWARLACKGNPSVLHFLFAPDELIKEVSPVWGRVRARPDTFLAKSHLSSYLGYGNAQLSRLQNQRGGKDVHRPYLEELYGYDTKYAMHIVRLMMEAEELMRCGWVTLPRPEKDYLMDIRRGKYPLNAVIEEADRLQRAALEAQQRSPLPEQIDRSEVSKLVSECYRQHWASKAQRSPE